ncbi:MAG: TrmB family transcriptional regulator [Clostridiales bacterium]|nr:TrmB family transcriptional regulator [Clostridiales bacterium]
MENMISKMKQLGMTEYEVKTYLSLLKHYPSNGYGLSKYSGVPRSRIYEILEGLERKKLVFTHKEDSAVTYSPLEPKLLISKLKENFDSIIDEVEAVTTALYSNDKEIYEQKTVKGYHEIIDLCKLLINDAQSRIALSIWDEELSELKDVLNESKEKGILLRGIHFGHKKPFDELVTHRRMERYIAEKHERYIILIIDKKHVVTGIVSREEDARITWSSDPSDIDIKDDFIAHDVMINQYSKLIADNESYEKTLDLIRKDYYCFSDEAYEVIKDA